LAKLRRRAEGAPVSFHLDVPDLSHWVRRSDIVLFPTVTEEVFGYSAVDGMAAGKPVIFSQVSAVLEVTDGIGIPVAPGDPKRLGEAIRSLVREPDTRADLGRRGRELVLERYAWDKAFARYEALLIEAAGR
jgi:glycosyltransferase involved in cell wall biosynthesis